MKTVVNKTFEPHSDDMQSLVRGGVVATGISQFVKLITQMLSVMVLSRLLTPADFGLVGMATPFYGLVTLFQDLGLSQAIIQKKDISHDDVNSLFWINIAVGIILCVVLYISAPLSGLFYKNPEVSTLMLSMAILPLVAAIGALPNSLLARRMAFGALALIDAGGVATGFAAALIFALIFHNFWALYASMVVATVVSAAASFLFAGWWPGLPRITSGARSMLHFGAGITGFNLTNFIARNLDNALIGRRWGSDQLGYYDRSYKLLLLPLQQVTNPLSRVMVPALSRLNDSPERYQRAFFKSFGIMLCVTSPGIVFMSANASKLIPFIMGARWAPCVPIFEVLGLIGLLQVVNNPSGWLIISQARTKFYAIWGVVTAVTSATAFLVGLPYGPIGVAVAYGISEFVRTPLLWWFVTRRGPVTGKSMLGNTLPVSAAVILSLAVEFLAAPHIGGPVVVSLCANLVVSYAVFGAFLSVFPRGRELIGEGLSQVRLGAKRQSKAEIG